MSLVVGLCAGFIVGLSDIKPTWVKIALGGLIGGMATAVFQLYK